jgi:chaperonin GroEL
VELEDEFENMGAQLVLEASENTNDKAGDGTTTSILLAQAIVDEGLRNVSAGTNPMAIKRELDEASDKVVKRLKKISKPITTKEEKQQVATISAQDEKIGELIAEAMEQVGDDGVVTIEEGSGFDIELELKEGMHFDRGYASPNFVTNLGKMEAEMKDAYILFVDFDIEDITELIGMLDEVVKTTKKLVIIAPDFTDRALGTLVLNHLQGIMQLVAIKAPQVGQRRTDILEDMAILTGGQLISKATGRNLISVVAEDLGRADKVVVGKDETIILGGQHDKKEVESRVEHVKEAIANTRTEFDELKLKERLAMMTGGIAVFNVGAMSEVEQRERKLRVEDAVNATKAAVKEGIVAGGGVALLEARKVLESSDKLGYRIIHSSLKAPAKKILENAGLDAGELLRDFTDTEGFNVMKMKFEDMLESGIVDPTKVTRSALQNAVSVANMVITTDCLICEIPNQEDKLPRNNLPKDLRRQGIS